MKKVAIVSCDKWLNKLEEDNNLKCALNNIGIDASIISWQQPLKEKYDLLILKSIWGYQNYYNEFKKWLLHIKNNNISIENNVDIVLNNIMKDIQFNILKKNNIDLIDTVFLQSLDLSKINSLDIINSKSFIIKPSISGSGENTYLVNDLNDISNILNIYESLLNSNNDCKIMIQPFIPEIRNGEYSCIFIDGKLTHIMLRFPGVFGEKKRPFLVNDVPNGVIDLAQKVEKIEEFKGYLYMRVDIVSVNENVKIMEVELADPDLLTKYIDDINIKSDVINSFARKIERRIR